MLSYEWFFFTMHLRVPPSFHFDWESQSVVAGYNQAKQTFSQTLKTGPPEGMFSRLSEFSLYFFQKWASIGWLNTLLAKTLRPDLSFHHIIASLRVINVVINAQQKLLLLVFELGTVKFLLQRRVRCKQNKSSFCFWQVFFLQ